MKKILLIIFLVLFFWNCPAFARPILPDVEENQIQIFFLSPLKQKIPKNECKSSACRTLLKNINEAQDSIDFAIYGINDQDKIFNALIKAKKRGVKIRWVTDLNEKNRNVYHDTYELMHKIPTYNTDYDSI
jgi:phosphatidylserine/phosphatidylglycerophosphate/cardiolipin synthase-like enzyme